MNGREVREMSTCREKMLTENGRVTYAYGMTMPSVACAPFMVSDVEFQAGEFVNDVVMGDTIPQDECTQLAKFQPDA